jgi:hypothetical protein
MIKILCSAIHVKDGKKYEHQPKNIDLGFVVCGRRHHNCSYTISLMGNPEYKNMAGRDGQGFLTTDDRFVSRKEAYLIAKEAGQLLHNLHDISNPILISEDVW